jgi:hypothetical protein
VRHAACIGQAAWKRPAIGELARGQARSVRRRGGKGVVCGVGEQRRLHPGMERLRSSSSYGSERAYSLVVIRASEAPEVLGSTPYGSEYSGI